MKPEPIETNLTAKGLLELLEDRRFFEDKNIEAVVFHNKTMDITEIIKLQEVFKGKGLSVDKIEILRKTNTIVVNK